ncbi:MAG: hypothetical protein R2764_12260 [Bacteroidales bacterium]
MVETIPVQLSYTGDDTYVFNSGYDYHTTDTFNYNLYGYDPNEDREVFSIGGGNSTNWGLEISRPWNVPK